jgi:Cys-tRNA(Pro) deacylase
MTPLPPGAPAQLLAFLRAHRVEFELLAPGVPMPTVPAAAAAIGVPPELILKTLLFAGDEGAFVVAIANGTRRVNLQRLSTASGLLRPRPAKPDVVFHVTGYPAGGVSPLGLPEGLKVIVDRRVAKLPVAYGGGGLDHLLLRLRPADIIRLNNASTAPIVDDDRPEPDSAG